MLQDALGIDQCCLVPHSPSQQAPQMAFGGVCSPGLIGQTAYKGPRLRRCPACLLDLDGTAGMSNGNAHATSTMSFFSFLFTYPECFFTAAQVGTHRRNLQNSCSTKLFCSQLYCCRGYFCPKVHTVTRNCRMPVVWNDAGPYRTVVHVGTALASPIAGIGKMPVVWNDVGPAAQVATALVDVVTGICQMPVVWNDVGPAAQVATALVDVVTGICQMPVVWNDAGPYCAAAQVGIALAYTVTGSVSFFSPSVPYRCLLFLVLEVLNSVKQIGEVHHLLNAVCVCLAPCAGWPAAWNVLMFLYLCEGFSSGCVAVMLLPHPDNALMQPGRIPESKNQNPGHQKYTSPPVSQGGC